MNPDKKYEVSKGVYVLNESGTSPESATMRALARSFVDRARKKLEGKSVKLVPKEDEGS